MRLAYVCYWDTSRRDGVTRKLETQVEAWRSAGHEAVVFAIRPAPLPRRLRETQEVVTRVLAFRPDVVYLRYDTFLPPVAVLPRRRPTVVEVNTDDTAEWRLRGRLAAAYNRVNRTVLLRASAGLVCVSCELARAPAIARFRKPAVVIANGIDPDVAAPSPPPANDRPRLVFSGMPGQPWQGVDKIEELARMLPEWRFDLVGIPPERLARRDAPNVAAHGFLAPERYHRLLAGADVALGTLALHRKRMDEASPLKVREYLLYGLPVVIGYEDTDFAGASPWYLLRVPNDEDNVRRHLREIVEFVERTRGRRVARDEVVDRIGAPAKEAARLEFLERVAHGAR